MKISLILFMPVFFIFSEGAYAQTPAPTLAPVPSVSPFPSVTPVPSITPMPSLTPSQTPKTYVPGAPPTVPRPSVR
jgi:hypothetical protein